MKIIICVLVVTLCAVAALSGCGEVQCGSGSCEYAYAEKPFTYSPPALSKESVYGSSVVSGQVMGTHVYKQSTEYLKMFPGHDQPKYTTLELAGHDRNVNICGDQRNAFKLGSRITIVVEDSPRSDYDNCYTGWGELITQ